MKIRVHEMYYPDDEGPYEEEIEGWVYDDVAGTLRQNGESLLQAFKAKYSGAKLEELGIDIEGPSYARGKDWSETTAGVRYRARITAPGTQLADDADAIDGILESTPISNGRNGWLGELVWECTDIDTTDEGTILECELSGNYKKEDSAY